MSRGTDDSMTDDSITRWWQAQARAAGWSPPVPSKLRVVEKCQNDHDGCTESCFITNRRVYQDGCEVLRSLTPAETNEVAEECYRGMLLVGEKLELEPENFLILSSGLKVILVEKNDATNRP